MATTGSGLFGEKNMEKAQTRTDEVKMVIGRLNEIYKFNQYPPECFVAQMAFTDMNSFMLTTDGRLFSWGA